MRRTAFDDKNFSPLTNNEENAKKIALLRRWRQLLETDAAQRSAQAPDAKSMDPYHRLVWEAWMPPMRRYIREQWSPKSECDQLIDALNRWMPTLPAWIVDNVLTQCVLPRISQEVDK